MESSGSTQIYTNPPNNASVHGEIFRAVSLVREAAGLLKSKATHLPHSSPG